MSKVNKNSKAYSLTVTALYKELFQTSINLNDISLPDILVYLSINISDVLSFKSKMKQLELTSKVLNKNNEKIYRDVDDCADSLGISKREVIAICRTSYAGINQYLKFIEE